MMLLYSCRKASVKSEVQLHQAAVHCPNCDTRLGGKFCRGCGQPAHLHVPRARIPARVHRPLRRARGQAVEVDGPAAVQAGQADAMRRVYGDSRTVTALRWIVLMTLHMLSIATAIALATALALAG